jgi:hypothetical protein
MQQAYATVHAVVVRSRDFLQHDTAMTQHGR